MRGWKKIWLMAIVTLLPMKGSAQLLAVNTDVALLATQTYNVGFEMTVSNRSTLSLAVLGNYHPWVLSNMRCIAVQPEWRYYLSGRSMMSHFVGFSVLAANYDFTWKEENHHGDALGAGVTFGYVLPLSERLNIDFHAGVGLIFYNSKEYKVSSIILPTKIGISLSYIIR